MLCGLFAFHFNLNSPAYRPKQEQPNYRSHQDLQRDRSDSSQLLKKCCLRPPFEVLPPNHQNIILFHLTPKAALRSRYQVVVESGVLSSRGIRHVRVSQKQFVENFRTKPRKIAYRFASKKHKMSGDWAEIFAKKRTWVSTTPNSFRVALAGWHWLTTYRSIPEASRPRLTFGRLSDLLPARHLVITPEEVCIYIYIYIYYI